MKPVIASDIPYILGAIAVAAVLFWLVDHASRRPSWWSKQYWLQGIVLALLGISGVWPAVARGQWLDIAYWTGFVLLFGWQIVTRARVRRP